MYITFIFHNDSDVFIILFKYTDVNVGGNRDASAVVDKTPMSASSVFVSALNGMYYMIINYDSIVLEYLSDFIHFSFLIIICYPWIINGYKCIS